MYRRIEGGTIVDIQGLPCCVPPEGYVWNVLTNKLEYTGVYQRSKHPKEQYWERFAFPSWYKEVTKREDEYLKTRKDDSPPFYDEKYEEYKRQEWFRRLNGMWIMIKGEAVFIPPIYYYILQWFRIDVGYAKFTKPHLKACMFLTYCIDDPVCWGMLGITKRRFLKTYMIGAFIVEYITRTKNTNGALQSKTGNDAKKVFAKAIVYPFRGMPRFFRPEYDMSLGINPKTEIRFQQTNIRGKKAEDNLDKEELGSAIDWGSADPVHYDGSKIFRYGSDEWGKTTEANVFDRNEVVRYCQLDEEGNIIGKSLWFTTVEKLESDKDGVQVAAKQLWDASDQNNRKENGQTESGLYRFFQTADESKNFDIYGDPDVEKTVRDILSDRESVKNNPRALSARMRKEPRTIQEAFSADAENCAFNSIKLGNRKQFLEENPIKVTRSIWYYPHFDENGVRTVRWRDITDAEKNFHWRVNWVVSEDKANKHRMDGRQRVPDNTGDGCITVDSYSNSQGGRKYGSKACAWLGRRYDILDPENTGRAVAVLYGRPAVKDTLHEQVMLAAEYHGYKVWYEHTADDYEGYFRERGRGAYLGLYPMSLIDPNKRETAERYKGTPITPFSLTSQLDKGISYVENHCDMIDWIELLENMLIFDPYDRTSYDMVVAWLMLIACLQDLGDVQKRRKAPLIPTYGQPNLSAA